MMIDELAFSRRNWLKLVAGTAGGLLILRGVAGCGYYAAESGAAFTPWTFPGDETAPEMIAARAAILAASPHNSQPWLLHVTATNIDLHADLTRGLGSIDSQLRELYIGLGCALENLVIAAGTAGRASSVTVFPDPTSTSLVASIGLAPSRAIADPLFDAIAVRHTNRGRYADAPVAATLADDVQALVTDSGIELALLVSDADRAAFRAGTIDATVAFIADAEMSHDSNLWYRQTSDDILEHRDGITIDCSGNGAATVLLSKEVGRPSDATANSYWLDGTRGDQTTGSAFGILSSSATNTRADQLAVGRTFQRLHLWAVTQGLAVQPLNQLAELQDREESTGATPRFTAILNGLIGTTDRRGQMLFRIGYPWDTAHESPRRPLEWVTV